MSKIVILVSVAALTALAVFAAFQYRNHSTVPKTSEANTTDIHDAFVQYKNKYNLKWGASESDKRFNIFAKNFEVIANHPKNSSYTLGLTPLAHLTFEEFTATKLGFLGGDEVTPEVDVAEESSPSDDDTVDWVARGAVTPVPDEGQCGACWAFSAIGAIEGLEFITKDKLIPLSVQQIIDCDTDGNMGCNGGFMVNSFKYAMKHGIASEKDYPYTGVDGVCQKKPVTFRIKGFGNVTANSDKALGEAIKKQPISIAVEADSQQFQLYTGGVITSEACGTQLDHAGLAVGYGVDKKQRFVKVRNTWGPNWGENGYVRIGRANGPGICGINVMNSYPTV